jgi:hypothetical protein
MSKNCQHKVPCGCNDKPLVTNPLVCESGTPDCPAPEACPETFCDICLVHCTDNIVDVAFNKGDRYDVILQKIALFLTNPGCITPNTSGQVGFVTITQGGSGYTPSVTTTLVPLLGGSGTGAIATVTTDVSGIITVVVITTAGSGYIAGDVLVPDPALVGTPALAAVLTVSTDLCGSVVGLRSLSITTTTIELGWLPQGAATEYQVEYKLATALSWTLVAPVTPTVGAMIETQTVGALIPNTEYHFRVDTTCHFGSCYSVTILVTTKI